MKRRAGLGGSMRSVVGFLSQRGLHGDPLLTQDFQRRRLWGCRNLYKKDPLGHFGCVNAIEFSNNGGQWLEETTAGFCYGIWNKLSTPGSNPYN
ncbi:DDB1- and CUL4-associated factor 5 [Sciurus carolinensis]|uniref:DDB1- and CUL4-associated factor 5 n=1 Tax=Sciurus carolinensis TaxID=30640 RepID=A0AA41SP93_SCICA|nr:DDB1- and CUL4-associated factor 5 [Sciurus carolinensis]